MIEEKVTTEGTRQEFFRPDKARGLIESMGIRAKCPWITDEGIELIGVSDTSINITYDQHPDEDIRNRFNVQPHAFCDYYAIEFEDSPILKIYDQDLSKHPIPSLPPGSRLDPLKSGIGLYYTLERQLDKAKIYFLHNDVNLVHDHFADMDPIRKPAITNLTYFGLEFDTKTMQTLNLSQYTINDEGEDLGEIR